MPKDCKTPSCVSVSRYPPSAVVDSGGTGAVPAAMAKSARRKPEERFDFVISPSAGRAGNGLLQAELSFDLDPRGRNAAVLLKTLLRAVDKLKTTQASDLVSISIGVPASLLVSPIGGGKAKQRRTRVKPKTLDRAA